MYFRNGGIYVQVYTASRPRKTSSSSPLEPKMSLVFISTVVFFVCNLLHETSFIHLAFFVYDPPYLSI